MVQTWLPCNDYYLFRNLKSYLRGTQFAGDESLKAAAEAWFMELNIEFSFQDINHLAEKWQISMNAGGKYKLIQW